MSGISPMNFINNISVTTGNEIKPVTTDIKAAPVKEAADASAVVQPEIEELQTIGISKDGDTAKASGASLNALDDGIVMLKSDVNAKDVEEVVEESDTNKTEEIKARLDAAEEHREQVKENLAKAQESIKEAGEEYSGSDQAAVNLTGYSAQELEKMYRNGEISRNDYDNELSRRESLEEINGTDPGSLKESVQQFEKVMSDLASAKTQAETENMAYDKAIESGQNTDILNAMFNNVQ